MTLTITRAMLDALDQAKDKPDWLISRLTQLKSGPEPYRLPLSNAESTALEELCTMNIRFDANDQVLPEHRPLEELSLLIMQNY
jgi:hypothetical protein